MVDMGGRSRETFSKRERDREKRVRPVSLSDGTAVDYAHGKVVES